MLDINVINKIHRIDPFSMDLGDGESFLKAVPIYCYYFHKDKILLDKIRELLHSYERMERKDIRRSDFYYYIPASYFLRTPFDTSLVNLFRNRMEDERLYADECLFDLYKCLTGNIGISELERYEKIFRGRTNTLPYITFATYRHIKSNNKIGANKHIMNIEKKFQQFIHSHSEDINSEWIPLKIQSEIRNWYYWWDWMLITKLFSQDLPVQK